MIGSLRCKDGEGKGKRRVKSEFAGFQSSSGLFQLTVLTLANECELSFRKRKNVLSLPVYVLHKFKHEIRHFHVPSRGRGKEMYEKAKCACKVVVLLIVYCVFKVLVAVAGNVLCSSHELLKANPLSASHNKVLNQSND